MLLVRVSSDAIYTPDGLAAWLVAFCAVDQPAVVADFAMGDGSLLRAARDRWPQAILLGNDIDRRSAQSLAAIPGAHRWYCADFLRAKTRKIKVERAAVDVVLLNPPFSCRGGARLNICFAGKQFKASMAMAFVANALDFLTSNGELLAILPASCLRSQKDAELVAAISELFSVSEIGHFQGAFAGHAVAVSCIRVCRRSLVDVPISAPGAALPVRRVKQRFSVELLRGNLPVARASSGSGHKVRPFIHSTELVEGKVSCGARKTDVPCRIIAGPALLLPRVGRPSVTKICVYNGRQSIALSDCIIALRTAPAGNEARLARMLRDGWQSVSDAYFASCAPYITLDKVRHVLSEFGIESRVVVQFTSVRRNRKGTPRSRKDRSRLG